MIAAIFRITGIVLVAAILFAGCTTTITRSKSPVFRVPTDSLTHGLSKMVSFENINLDGREITTNGKTASELEIDILNGKNIPADSERMKALGRSIASYLKKALQDPGGFDSFKVLFVTRSETNGVTTRNWTGAVFKSAEL